MTMPTFAELLAEARAGEDTYLHRTALAFVKNATVRNVSEEEVPSIIAGVENKWGKPFAAFTDGELRKINRVLPETVAAYVGETKRR